MDDSQPNDVRAGVVHGLVSLAPTSPETIRAIDHFLSLPLNHATRIDALNAIGAASGGHVTDDALIGLAGTYLSDPDEH